jgi:hypothetical protein
MSEQTTHRLQTTTPLLTDEVAFYTFAREERQLIAVLAHLLMIEGENLHRFVDLVAPRASAAVETPSPGQLSLAQVYVEFAFLRDWWNKLLKDTAESRRGVLLDLIHRLPYGRDIPASIFPEDPEALNRRFISSSTRRRISQDQIQQPSHWSVKALDVVAREAGLGAEAFRNLCMLKWS